MDLSEFNGDIVKINGRSYDVIVVGIEENFSILYSDNTGRTLSETARMTLDPIGTFIGHKVKFARKNGHEDDYDALFDFVSTPRFVGVDLEIVHGQQIIKYEAYVSSGSRAVRNISKKSLKVYWGELELNFVPMEAQVTPNVG